MEQLSSFIPNAAAFGFRREHWTGMLSSGWWDVSHLWAPEAGPWNGVRSSKNLLLSSFEFPACVLELVPSSSTALFTTISSSQQQGRARWGSQSSHKKCNQH